MRSLPSEDRQELVQALLEIPDMRQALARSRYLAALEQVLGTEIEVVRHKDDRWDVWEIVQACATYPGALWALVSMLEDFHAGSAAMGRLRAVASLLLPEPLLQPPERADLRRVLADVGATVPWADLYHDVAGPIGDPLGPSVPGNVWKAAAGLEDLVTPAGGVPPLIAFVDRLAARVDPPRREELLDWNSRVARRLGVDAAVVHQGADRTVPDRCYLVVEMVPDGMEPDRYLLSAWFERSAQRITLVHKDTPSLAIEVAAGLDELVSVASRFAPDEAPLTVEFILPRRLLSEPVDLWQLGDRSRVGVRYPVVVRSLDRLRNEWALVEWRRRWRLLQQIGDRPAPGAIWWLREPDQLPTALYRARLAALEEVVCVVCERPGPEDSSVVTAALTNGVPVILWPREPVDADTFAATVRGALDHEGLRTLPDLAHRLRRAAEIPNGSARVGRGLTLLWDDPDRLPSGSRRLGPPDAKGDIDE